MNAVFTNQPRALQIFSAAVSSHTERSAGWLAIPVRTGAPVERFAHSTVANVNTSSHGSHLMPQAVISCSLSCFMLVAGQMEKSGPYANLVSHIALPDTTLAASASVVSLSVFKSPLCAPFKPSFGDPCTPSYSRIRHGSSSSVPLSWRARMG